MAGRAEHQARWTRWNHALADDADEQTSEVSSLRTIRRTLEYPLFKMPWIEPFLRFCSNFPLTCVLLLHLSAVHGECARPPVENRRRTCFYSLGIQIRSWEGQTVMHHDHVVCVLWSEERLMEDRWWWWWWRWWADARAHNHNHHLAAQFNGLQTTRSDFSYKWMD